MCSKNIIKIIHIWLKLYCLKCVSKNQIFLFDDPMTTFFEMFTLKVIFFEIMKLLLLTQFSFNIWSRRFLCRSLCRFFLCYKTRETRNKFWKKAFLPFVFTTSVHYVMNIWIFFQELHYLQEQHLVLLLPVLKKKKKIHKSIFVFGFY